MYLRQPKRSRPIRWGESTVNEEGENRRVIMTDLPYDTTRQMIENFFGAHKIAGGCIINHPKTSKAFVQLDRPADYTDALLKNRSPFFEDGPRVTIKPYKDTRESSRKRRSRSRSPNGDRGYHSSGRQLYSNTRPELTRASDVRDSYRHNGDPGRHSYPNRHSRSDRNDNMDRNHLLDDRSNLWRDNEPSLNNELLQRKIESQTQILPPNSHAFGVTTPAMPLAICAPPSQQYIPNLNYGPVYPMPVTTSAGPAPFSTPARTETIPIAMKCLLELVLHQGPGSLSDEQFKQILDYFESERAHKLNEFRGNEIVHPSVPKANNQKDSRDSDDDKNDSNKDDDDSDHHKNNKDNEQPPGELLKLANCISDLFE